MNQVDHSLVDATSVDARVEILRAALNADLEVAHPPKSVGETGRLLSQPVVVTDAEEVHVVQEIAWLSKVGNGLEETITAVPVVGGEEG